MEKAGESGELNLGHRKNLREKFLKSGMESFRDYEIIELLLSLGTPRRDCKAPAKDAISRFKTLRGVLEASPKELQQIKGIGPHNLFGIKLCQEVARAYLKSKMVETPFYQSSKEVFDYLYHSMRGLKKEIFKIMYLTSRNQIIDTIDLTEGTVNSSLVSVREVVEAAFEANASSLIFVHNHPSGDPTPSRSDKSLTRELVYAGKIMKMNVVDHIVIGNDRYYSFAGEGLLQEYETDFMNTMLRGTTEARKRLYSKSNNDK